MPDSSTLLLFGAAALALIVVPGPAVLYIVAQSIDRGRLAGFVSALGVAVGGLVHVTAAAIGLSSLLVSSATAFNVVKYAGAAYLIGLGLWTLLRRRDEPSRRDPAGAQAEPPLLAGRRRQHPQPEDRALLLRLPAAVRRSRTRARRRCRSASSASSSSALAVVSDSVWALAAGTASERLRGSRRFLAVQRYVSGLGLRRPRRPDGGRKAPLAPLAPAAQVRRLRG